MKPSSWQKKKVYKMIFTDKWTKTDYLKTLKVFKNGEPSKKKICVKNLFPAIETHNLIYIRKNSLIWTRYIMNIIIIMVLLENNLLGRSLRTRWILLQLQWYSLLWTCQIFQIWSVSKTNLKFTFFVLQFTENCIFAKNMNILPKI